MGFARKIFSNEWYYHIAHTIGAGAMGFLAYRTWIAINNLRTRKIFLKSTSSGINYRNVEKTYAIAWSDISEFLIEHDTNEFLPHSPARAEKRFCLVTKGNSDKICIDIRFGYDEMSLAELMAAKMRQSLNLSLGHELVYVEKMVWQFHRKTWTWRFIPQIGDDPCGRLGSRPIGHHLGFFEIKSPIRLIFENV